MKNILKILLIVIFSAYIFLSFLFAFNGFPGFTQDASCFLPTAYFINHYHQLINPLYDAGLDPIKHKFLFYPPLFPYTIAYIIKLLPDFVNNIQIALTIINFFSVIILFISIYIYCRKSKIYLNTFMYFFLIVWLLSLFSFYFYGIIDGRPENLSKFFIACFLLNNVNKNKFYNLNDGLIIGLLLITSPISAFYLMVIKTGLFFYQNNFKLKPIMQTLVGFIIILLCFAYLYPYHLTDLIDGLQKHSKNVIINRAEPNVLKNFFTNYITNVYLPFFIFNFLIVIGYVYYIIIKNNKKILISLLVLLTLLICFFSFRNMMLIYNMYVLAPFCFFLLFIIFVEINKRTFTPFLKFSIVLIVLLLLVNSIGFIRESLLYFNSRDNNISYMEFRKDFIKVCNATKKDKKIVITFSLWPYCLDKYKSIISWTTMLTPDTSVQYIMVQQIYSGQSEPQPKFGYKVIKNGFIIKHPKLGKIPLGNTYPGFQSAIYKRE